MKPSPNSGPKLPTPSPVTADATEWLRRIRAGECSAVDMVRWHLDRIEALQPTLNAAVDMFRDRALAEAAAPRPGPLSGLPVTVKETFGLAGATVTAGSRLRTPQHHGRDCALVQRLRDAGAIVIARSNVPEFAMTAETTNPRYGRTANPLDPARTAGGSSGGEGALVSSRGSALGFGSDILGSIRYPAAFCGVVGFRPASGAVDREGTWPVIDTATGSWLSLGPLARSVRDIRLAYDVIARSPAAPPGSSLRGIRLIGPEGFPLRYREPYIAEAVDAAGAVLEEAGARRETHGFTDVRGLYRDIPAIMLGEHWSRWIGDLSGQAGRFSVPGELVRRLAGRGRVDPGFLMWLLLGWFWRPRRASLARIEDRYRLARERYQRLLGEDGILLLPTVGMLAPRHGAMNRATLRPGPNGLVTPTTFCNYCDLPAISIPAWRHADPATGLPPSVMLACAPGAEGRLLDAAAVVESALGVDASLPTGDAEGGHLSSRR